MDSTKGGVMVHNGSESSLVVDVKANQVHDPILVYLEEVVHKKSVQAFSQGGDGIFRYQVRFCVSNIDDLLEKIMTEAHSSWYSIHPRAIKMYRALREAY
ncbi:hypothetical protein MTR67_018145 [Solanum verrucosum]|uniref:Uncharacterized protein n=1 Tax=Solanum verrucosum TaxID=315347 RepID=A0AAF0TSU0_SOLVR|nr:hypothetical protein MTR67_018145 [Solanum verrucosum]